MTCMFTAMATKEKLDDPILVEEAEKLKKLFIAHQQKLKSQGIKYSQRNIANAEKWSQTNVANYLNGYSPLNPNAASIFAKHLECSVEDFSPRLYKQIHIQASNSGGQNNNIRNVKEVLVYDSKNLEIFLGFIDKGESMAIAKKKEYLTGDLPEGIFGFVQPDNSLDDVKNESHEGDTYIIDQTRAIKPGNTVLARISPNEYELRKIKVIEVDEDSKPLIYELNPVNPDYPKRTVNVKTSSIKLVGVAIRNINNLVDDD